MSQISKIPNRVLVFNPLKRLVAIYQSCTATALAFGAKVQSIHYACNGECISCHGYYFRKLDDDIEVTLDDLGTLTVEEYDKLCGVERKLYANKRMTRKGMRYKKGKSKSKVNETKTSNGEGNQ